MKYLSCVRFEDVHKFTFPVESFLTINKDLSV